MCGYKTYIKYVVYFIDSIARVTSHCLQISLLQFIPVKCFAHLSYNLSTDMRGQRVSLRRMCEVADTTPVQDRERLLNVLYTTDDCF